jgi:hypothetical protein
MEVVVFERGCGATVGAADLPMSLLAAEKAF